MKKLIVMLATLFAISSVLALIGCGEKKQYTVSFDSDGGTAVVAQTIEEGSLVTEPTAPTKDSNETYTYTFAGWYNGDVAFNFASDKVSGDLSLKAKWTSNYVNYTVLFKDEDGTELLKKEDYHYGDSIVAPTENPSKDEDKYQTYAFAGWGELGTVSENKEFVATYNATAKAGYSTHDVVVNGDSITLKAGALRKEGDSLDGRLTGGNYSDESVNQAYLGLDGNYGKNSYVVVDFTGKNMPILAYFAKNYNHSMYTGPLDTENNGVGSKDGVVILTGLTNNDGDTVEEAPTGSTYVWGGTGLLQCGPNMVYWTDRESGADGYYYGTNKNAPVHARLGKDGKNSALGRANLVDGTHYRVIIGNSFSGKEMSTNYMLYNLDTDTVVETKSYETWGHFSDQFCQGSAEEYLTGSIVLYGYFGIDTVIDQLYPIFTNTDVNTVAKKLGMAEGLTTKNVSYDGEKIILGAGSLGEGATLKGANTATNVNQSYYAIDGEYGKGSYLTIEFTGKNMPNLAFFAKNYGESMYSVNGEKEGIVVATGLTQADGTLWADVNANGSTDIHDGKGLVMYGPHMLWTTDNDRNAEGQTYRQDCRMRENSNCSLGRANLVDGVHYRVVIGLTTGADARAVRCEYYLYNMDEQTVVEKFQLDTWNFFTDSFSVDKNTFFTGSIILYGQFGTTVTIDKLYEVSVDTTLQAVVEGLGMTFNDPE